MRLLTLGVIGLLVLLSGPLASLAQTPVDGLPVVRAESSVTLDFPTGLEIEADLEWSPDLEPSEVVLLYTIASDPTWRLAFANANIAPGSTSADVSVTLDLQTQFVPAGVDLTFVWQLEHEQVVLAESEPATTSWFDNRFEWAIARSDQVRLHTYDLSDDFTATILDSAQSTVTELEGRYGLDPIAPLDIWVYGSASDLRGAQQPNSRESVAGASYPGFDLIVAVLPEGNDAELGRVIPHEISHQVIHQATRNPFSYPPLWFDEGMATHAQVGGTASFDTMIEGALDDDRLFHLTSLEVTFPYSAAEASLAYAVSWSAIAYITATYGDDGISALLEAFAEGTSNDIAIENALGIDAEQLSADWQAWERANHE